jgi:exodeoxyribonuclease-3
MIIASWNVNSIKARLPRVVEWLEKFSPDIALLQELKCTDDNFPRLEIEALGYHVETHGQKTYNGVAILSKHPMENITRGLDGAAGAGPDGDDIQARYMEATIKGLRVAAIYLPNGNPVPGPKYDYKLKWMDRLIIRAKELLESEQIFLLGGDYNIIPKDIDCYAPARFEQDALCLPASRDRYYNLLNLGLTDALRQIKPSGEEYSYWDYQGGAWNKGNGIRIDHLLLSPRAADLLKDAEIDRKPRGRERPSDHTPIWCRLNIS